MSMASTQSMCDDTKTCSGCGATRGAREFRKGGRRCKSCIAAYAHQYYLDHQDEIRDTMKAYAQNRAADIKIYQSRYYAATSTHKSMKNKILMRF